ncbi:hypothetical protein BDV59DRAFT_199699 [Aspergillus ambiguus]|uniref:uncharacterized protein n=1 Tax=Aspergillus ambiguus TaxID=176160 RepID=UPI003CCDEB52
MPQSPRPPRLLACARCFRLKRKCDHVKPTCGECRRRGTECLPVKSSKDGEDITIPLKYLKYLESRVAELEDGQHGPAMSPPVRDAGVQTDPVHEPEDMSLDKLPLNPTPGGWRLILQQLLSNPEGYHVAGPNQFPDHTANSAPPLLLLPDSRAQPQRLEEPLISRLAYEIYQDGMAVEGPVGSPHALALTGEFSRLEEIYTNVYFSINQWVWPFIDSGAWRSWRQDWTVNADTDQWKGFFVYMVYAVGALSCNVFQPNHGHAMRAAEFYTSALVYYPFVMEHPSTILQIQASIFMILYALQCPSAEEIATTVSSIVPFCIASMAEIRKHAYSDPPTPAIGADGILTESLFITCYMLNEIVVSGWERPVSAAYKAIDDDIHTLGNEVPCSSDTSKALRHLFKLRKIQSNIRRHWEESPPQQDSSDSLRSELAAWREEIPRYGIDESPDTYLHPLWMANLYDYSIIILMQEKRHRLQNEDIEDILSASVEVCLTFRRLQEEGQVMCYTWSALVFQFRSGIMLLYMFWVAPRDRKYAQQATDALRSCANTLLHFADRWPDAIPYARVFEYLLRRGTWLEDDTTYISNHPCAANELDNFLSQLKKQYIHKAVLEMIEDMIYQPSQ